MLEFILGEIYNILTKMSSLTERDKDIIYDKVNYAINQTRTHIGKTRQRNIDKSSSTLSNIWQRTGKALKGIHHPEIKELAKTIEEKSKYWSDTEGYDMQNLGRYEMRLTEVENKLKRIFP